MPQLTPDERKPASSPSPPPSPTPCVLPSSPQPLHFPQHLQDLILTDANATHLQRKVIGVLRKMRLPRRLDLPSIAQDILLEAWEHHTPVSGRFIRCRAIDAIRRLRDELSSTIDAEVNASTLPETESLVHLLLNSSDLSTLQIQILHAVFWAGDTFEEVSRRLSIPRSAVFQHYADALATLRASARVHHLKESE